MAIPAYDAMQENGLSERVLDVLMRGISTRQYCEVLPEMASSCGVSKSNVSREAAEASEEALQELLERRFEDVDLLVIHIDGMMFGEHHVISAVGVDRAGHKHVLGIQSELGLLQGQLATRAAELWLQSDRDIHRSDVYFTNHTLTGRRFLCLSNGTMVALTADRSLASRCVLTGKMFRATKCLLCRPIPT